MELYRKRQIVVILCCLVSVFISLVGCSSSENPTNTPPSTPATSQPSVTITPSPLHTPPDTPTHAPATSMLTCIQASSACGIQFCLGTARDQSGIVSYFPNQLIITADPGTNGSGKKLGDIITQANLNNAGIQSLIEEFEVETGTVSKSKSVIGLYHVSGSPVDAATIFNSTADTPQFKDLLAKAEPNYVTSQPKEFAVGGAPGSSGIEGGPGAAPAAPTPGTPTPDFNGQWAASKIDGFVDSGYMIPAQQTRPPNSPTQLYVFDSSPWPSGGYFNNQLCVYDLLPSGPGQEPIDKHGLFASSLGSAMGKEDQVHLIQVLKYDPVTHNLRGDLFTLLGALENLYARSNPTLVAHSVINLSLGFEFNPAETVTHTTFVNSVRKNLSVSPVGSLIQDNLPTNDLPIISLGLLLHALEERGYVVVAAAGNRAEDFPQAPANYRTVIGVQASDMEVTDSADHRGCFSNVGDVSAPGGGSGAEPIQQIPCTLPIPTNCRGPACILAVTGHWDGDGTTIPVSYGFWAGTSFAAPFVSGLAATIIAEAQQPPNSVLLSPAQVRAAVYCIAMYRTTVASSTLPSPTTDPAPDPKPSSLGPSVGFITTDFALRQACINFVK